MSSMSHPSPSTQRSAVSLTWSIPHSKLSQGPMLSFRLNSYRKLVGNVVSSPPRWQTTGKRAVAVPVTKDDLRKVVALLKERLNVTDRPLTLAWPAQDTSNRSRIARPHASELIYNQPHRQLKEIKKRIERR